MKHPVRAAATLAFGVCLSAAAQAQGTDASADPPAINQPAPDRAATASLSQRQIAQAQRQMRAEGIYRGPIDAVMGRQTRAAIADFQLRDGLPRTGTLDERTRARLGSRSAINGAGSSAPPTVLRGTPVNPNAVPNGVSPPSITVLNGAGGNAANP
jgi:peptidoglycan hydrolase-like protein with peptidoglycan-binding domain